MNMEFESVRIMRIDEPEFGCEGRADDAPVMDKITLENESGEQFMIEVEEKRVWKLGIDEGQMISVLRREDGAILIQK